MGYDAFVGQIVLYTNLGDAAGEFPPSEHPALITRLNEDGTASLHIFYEQGGFDMFNVQRGRALERRTWHTITEAGP